MSLVFRLPLLNDLTETVSNCKPTSVAINTNTGNLTQDLNVFKFNTNFKNVYKYPSFEHAKDGVVYYNSTHSVKNFTVSFWLYTTGHHTYQATPNALSSLAIPMIVMQGTTDILNSKLLEIQQDDTYYTSTGASPSLSLSWVKYMPTFADLDNDGEPDAYLSDATYRLAWHSPDLFLKTKKRVTKDVTDFDGDGTLDSIIESTPDFFLARNSSVNLTNKWHHVSLVCEQYGTTASLTSYIDGNISNSEVYECEPEMSIGTAILNGLIIFGNLNVQLPDLRLADFRVYDEALSLYDISSIYDDRLLLHLNTNEYAPKNLFADFKNTSKSITPTLTEDNCWRFDSTADSSKQQWCYLMPTYGLKPNTDYVLSFDFYNASDSADFYVRGEGSVSFKLCNSQLKISGRNISCNIKNQWVHAGIIYNTGKAGQNLLIYPRITTNTGIFTDGYMLVRDIKIYEGDSEVLNSTNSGEVINSALTTLNISTDQCINNLPDTYQQLDYIESTGTQWIDTRYPMSSSNFKFNVKFAYTALTDYGTIVGAQSGSNGNFLFRVHSDTGFYVYPGAAKILDAVSVNTIYDLSWDINGIYWNSNINGYKISTSTSQLYSNNLNISLFNSTNGSNGTYGSQAVPTILAKARLYECKFWDNGSLVRDFVPCYRKSDNRVGLYDKVHGVFYTNVGTGDFVKGPIPNDTFIKASSNTLNGSSSLDFNGIDNYLKLPLKDYYLDGDFTISCWMYPRDWQNYRGVLGPHSANTSGGMVFAQYEDGCVQITASTANGWADRIKFKGWLNSWKLITLVVNRALGTARLYIDGVLSDNISEEDIVINNRARNWFTKASGDYITFGRAYFTPERYFKGYISDLRIYGKALSGKEVRDLSEIKVSINPEFEFKSKRFVTDSDDDFMSKSGVVNATNYIQNEYYTTDDGAKFLKIFSHDIRLRDEYFSDREEAIKCLNKLNRFSRLVDLNNFITNVKSVQPYPDYILLNYIESNGAQAITTDYIPNPNTRVVCTFKYNEIQAQDRIFSAMGTPDKVDNDGLVFESYINGNKYFAFASRDDTGQWKNTGIAADTNVHTVDLNLFSRQYIFDNGVYTATITDKITKKSDQPLNIFARVGNGTNTVACCGSARLYNMEIYDGLVMVKRLLPALRKEDFTLGLYDTINDEFLTNRGSDYFTTDAGFEFLLRYPEISALNGYTPLEYIQLSGDDLFDTGVTEYAKWEFDIQYILSGKRQLMGYGGSNCEFWGVTDDGYYGLIDWLKSDIKAGNRDNVIHDYRCTNESKWSVYVNGKLALEGAASVVPTNSYKIGNLTSSSNGYKQTLNLYRCKCYGTNGYLIRDFIPVRRNFDKTIGLYDVVNNIFYESSSTILITGPDLSEVKGLYNRWKQLRNPLITREDSELMSGAYMGYKPLHIYWSNYWENGLALSSNSNGALLDGMRNLSWWWFAIGQYNTYENGYLVGPDHKLVKCVELYVRVDTNGLYSPIQVKMDEPYETLDGRLDFKKTIFADDFIEY